MRYINVRQLLSDLSKSVEELPVIVTKYGKPYLFIDRVPLDLNTEEIRWGEKSQKFSELKDKFEERGKKLREIKETEYSNEFV